MSGSDTGGGWRALRRRFPRTVAVLATGIALFLVADAILLARWLDYRREAARLRDGMTDAERARADMLAASEARRDSVHVELLRRQAASDRTLHLTVSVDSGVMRLERDGALLREMRVALGEPSPTERADPNAPPPRRLRGTRAVERVLGANDAWELPVAAYTSRGLAPPSDRNIPGALGRSAVVLSGGTVIYALPDSGVLADSGYVLPGALRLSRSDLRAIAPVITAGLTVYFFE